MSMRRVPVVRTAAPRGAAPGGRLAIRAAIATVLVVATAVLAVRARSAPTPRIRTGPSPLIFRTTLFAEPSVRDPLRGHSVRVWATPMLAGTWCRLSVGSEVGVHAVARTPDLVFAVASENGDCSGWVDARYTSNREAPDSD